MSHCFVCMPETVRTFVALPVIATAALRQVLDCLYEVGGTVRAIDPDHLHITLTFLGDTPWKQTSEIGQVISETLSAYPSFELSLNGIGAFPNEKRPRVVWAGVEPTEAIASIANDLNERLSHLGFPREKRKYTPHLTLARIKGRPPRELFDVLHEFDQETFGRFISDSVIYFQSELGPSGPVYTVLSEFELGEPH